MMFSQVGETLGDGIGDIPAAILIEAGFLTIAAVAHSPVPVEGRIPIRITRLESRGFIDG